MDYKTFLKDNANKDFICANFTEVLRDLIRAVSASEDYHRGVSRAREQMNFVMDLISETEEEISWYELFLSAVEGLRPEIDWKNRDFDTLNVAEAGMSFFAEYTCVDAAAKARRAKKEEKFFQLIKTIKNNKIKQFAQ